MKISLAELEAKIIKTLEDRGYSHEEAVITAKPIVWAEAHGNNQGVLKLAGEAGLLKNTAEGAIETVKETANTAILDGHENNAMIVLQAAVDKALELLENSGVVIVGAIGTHSSSGALAYYLEELSSKGYLAILMARTAPRVAPFGTAEKLFGPNPLAISYPTEGDPLTFDMATSAMAFYAALQAATEGREVEADKLLDAMGQPTTDPNTLVSQNGMLLPFDNGPKGSSLGMMVELLAGPLIGAGVSDPAADWGHIIIAIDPEALSGRDHFRASVTGLIAKLRAAKTRDGKPVRLPGDHAAAVFAKTQTEGVEVSEEVCKKIGWE